MSRLLELTRTNGTSILIAKDHVVAVRVESNEGGTRWRVEVDCTNGVAYAQTFNNSKEAEGLQEELGLELENLK